MTWTGEVLRPHGVATPLALYDDGAHGDSLAGDGIYGNTVTPAGGVWQYALTATASVGPLAAVAYCELAESLDPAIGTSDIYLSNNVPPGRQPRNSMFEVRRLGQGVGCSDCRS